MKQVGFITKTLTALFILVSLSFADKFSEDYLRIKNHTKQKKEFVSILLPIIQKENEKILQEREFVASLFESKAKKLKVDREERMKLQEIAQKYWIDDIYDQSSYMKKIAPIPTSLALSQAALESGWAKSKIAIKENNIFGQYESKGKTKSPKKFDSLHGSVGFYMLNLNRNPNYVNFRKLRHQHDQEDKKLNGLKATTTMETYAALGKKYNKLLENMIKKHQWERLD